MRIKFAGFIGKRFGVEHQLAVHSPNEAIRALCQLVPGFRAFLTSAHERGIYFQIITSNTDDLTGVGYDELQLGCQSFTLVPVITGNFFGLFGGGKTGGILSILAGVALVAFAMTGFGSLVTWGAAGTISAGIQTATMSLGIGLIFTGVASLFAPGLPTQKNRQESAGADDAISRGAAPVAVNGQAVPLLYGEYLVDNMPTVASYIDNNEGYFLGLVSEGEIAGFPTSVNEDLYLDGMVAKASLIQNVQLTNGSQTTKSIDIVKSAGFSIPINVPFNPQGGDYDGDDDGTPNTQITRTFTQKEADTVTIRLSIGPVYQTKNKSDSGGSDSNFRDYTESDDSGGADNPTEIVIQILDGNADILHSSTKRFEKVTSTQLREYEFDIQDAVEPISMRVTRIDRKGPRGPVTKSGQSSQRQYTWTKSPVTWISADVTWAERLVYPYSSLLALKFAAGEFGQFPKIQARLKGLVVPTLNSSLQVSYSYSNNPAYILLDLLTNPRYGAGYRTYTIEGHEHVQAGIRMQDCDLASFKNAARYCEDKGITFNGYINKDADALELFRGVAATFQGQIIYAGGFITIVVDKKLEDTTNIRLYSSANTIGSGDASSAGSHFSYEGTGRRSRSTAVQVSFVDPSEFYTERKTLIEDAGLIDRYGYNLTQVRALGCTSEDQAKRIGRYTLASNTLSTETVSFKVGPDGAMLLPGDICLVMDPLKTNHESGGRIKTVADNRIIADRNLTARSSPTNWFLYVYGPSGVANKFSISSITSDGTIRIIGTFGSNRPSTMDMWAIVKENPTIQLAKEPMYRVQTIKENGDNTYTVIAIKYDKSKFDFVDGGSGAELTAASYTTRYSSGSNITIKRSSLQFQLRTPER